MKLIISYKKTNILYGLFLLGVFLKQFYIFDSGRLQISDVFFVMTFLLTIIFRKCRVQKKDYSLMIFVVSAFVINGVYMLCYRGGFIVSSIYLFYNLLIVITFGNLLKDTEFICKLVCVLKINIVTQLIIFGMGVGRYLGGSRYQGTFNDPNQYGYFILLNFFILYIGCVCIKTKLHTIWYVLTGFLVFISISSGMIVAYGIFILFTVIIPICSEKNSFLRIAYIIGFSILVMVVAIFGGQIWNYVTGVSDWHVINSITYRISQKTDKLQSSGEIVGFLKDRLLYRIVEAPYYFLYGCGEGMYERFISISGERGEMHSTMIALFYYYGIVPYLFFLKWIKDNLKGIPVAVYGVYIATILEAFTLANHRQPFFWMIFVIGAALKIYQSQIKTDNIIKQKNNVDS